MIRTAIFGFIIGLFCSCTAPRPKIVQVNFIRLLEDTTNNRRAKLDLEQLKHYNNICKAIGINRLYDGADSIEVRAWRQFSVFGEAADEEIYSLKLFDTTVSLTFFRVYCANVNYENGNYRDWDAFTDPKIDSFVAVSRTFPIKILAGINLQRLWELKTQSALHIPDNIGFTDGTTTSIEMASKSKYKLIKYHMAQAYYDETRIRDIKTYIDEYDKLIVLFQTHLILRSH